MSHFLYKIFREATDLFCVILAVIVFSACVGLLVVEGSKVVGQAADRIECRTVDFN